MNGQVDRRTGQTLVRYQKFLILFLTPHDLFSPSCVSLGHFSLSLSAYLDSTLRSLLALRVFHFMKGENSVTLLDLEMPEPFCLNCPGFTAHDHREDEGGR